MRQRRPVDRRTFLAGSAGAMGAAVFGGVPLGMLAEQGAPPPAQGWDSGQVRHVLPQVSDSRMLIKASFTQPLAAQAHELAQTSGWGPVWIRRNLGEPEI